jgi:transglutaminase-like putative cysteine protease
MHYRVVHTTSYNYQDTVPIAYNRICLAPRACPYQECLNISVKVTPAPAVFSPNALDYYGNQVAYFCVQEPHDELTIHAESEVRVEPVLGPIPESTPPWEEVRAELRNAPCADLLDAYQFAVDFEKPEISAELRAYAAPSFPAGQPVLIGAIDLMHRINKDFAYDPNATTVTTPIEEVLHQRRGVCQDFAHVQIGCLRALGLAARYVSGYITPVSLSSQDIENVGAQASHAWLAIFVPGHGWVDLDPTNDTLASEEHITLSWGRDYEEVSPVRGVIIGGGNQQLTVEVNVIPVPDVV